MWGSESWNDRNQSWNGVDWSSTGLTGTEVSVGTSHRAYYNYPAMASGRSMGVVIVHDIFGFVLPNCRYICDHMAKRGFDAILPDFFPPEQGVEPPGWPATETHIIEPLQGSKFDTWLTLITSEKFWVGFKSQLSDTLDFLRHKGCTRFCILGFGWGGRAAELAASTGWFAGCVSIDGWMHSAATYKEVKGSMLYVTVSDDPQFAKESQDAITDAGGKLKIYEGMSPGFATRGDYSNIKVKAAAKEIFDDAVALFDATCLRSAEVCKVGSVHPTSTGVTLMVKVTEEAKAVEAPRRNHGESKFYEVTVGDESAQVVLYLQESQIGGLTKGTVIVVRNASVRMIRNHIRLVVDKWGRLDHETGGHVGVVPARNMSSVEYDLVAT